jgi:hypothetical protein
MSEMLNQDVYYRQFSLWRQSEINAPKLYPIAKLCLPKLAILHYANVDGVSVGPQASDQIFLTRQALLYIDHMRRYVDPIGNPVKTLSNIEGMITEYRRRNRAFRPMRKLERLETDKQSLIVFNYSMLAHIVKYSASFRASYFMWYNIYHEVILNMNHLAKVSNRQQFIEIDLPDVIPPLAALREYQSNLTAQTLAKFRTPEAKLLADLFMWAGPERSKSLFGKLEYDNLSKINLIVRRLNGWVVINLGWLDSFRSEKNLPADTDPKEKKQREKGEEPKTFALRFLKLMTTIHQGTTPIATETGDAVLEEPLVEVNPDDAKIDSQDFDLEDEMTALGDSNQLMDDDVELSKLEKELEELDKLKDMYATSEQVDEEGDLIEQKVINVDLMAQKAGVAKEGEAMLNKADELYGKGLLTQGEYRRLERLSTVYETLPNPYGGEGSFVDAMKITREDVLVDPKELTNDSVVTDKSLAFSRVDAVDQKYIKSVLKKDIMRAVSSMQKGAVAITSYVVDRKIDAVNDREMHIVKFAPAVGVPSTVKFELPTIREDGTFLYNGTEYRMRKQRSDLPIRKVGPNRVALSSYYSKIFVERSNRKKFDYGKWLLGQLTVKCLDPDDPHISNAVLSDATNFKADVPMVYSTIAGSIAGFTVDKLDLYFDYKHRIKKFNYTKEELSLEKGGYVLCGRSKMGPLVMAPNGMIYVHWKNELQDLGTVESLCGIEIGPDSTPMYMAEMKIYSKTIPVGFALAYLLGIDELLKVLNVVPRRALVGERLNLQADEYAIRFKNESLIFKRSDVMAGMLLSGFNLYHSVIRNYDIELFNDRDVYAAVLERSGVGSRYVRELDALNTLFIDPITQDLLEWMKEPTTFTGLLVRATEMLQTNMVRVRREDKDRLVEGLERVRGYERVAGVVYETLSKAIRSYTTRSATGRASVVVNPNDTINALVQDPTTSPVNNINPIHSLREREVITFGGRGGRSRRAMVANTRLFTDEDMGFISEGTVDSGDVAIITYLSPNSNLTSVRGTVRMYDAERDGASALFSTAGLLSFGADGDDPKRLNFIQVQHGHGIMTVGSEVQGARTGMERVIASRMSPEFAVTAKQDGEVTEIAADAITVTMKDGTTAKYPLGLVHTTAEGSVYPNTIATTLKVGEKVKEFDVITYNQGFFKPSLLDKRRVDYMNGCIGRIALREATYTVEDSSSISVDFAKRMGTYVSKLKTIVVDFHDGISGLVKVGDKTDLDTILCTIEGAVSSAAGLYDDATRETLRNWAAMTPKAKAVGEVAKVEVFYNGEIDSMSDSLMEIVADSEKERKRSAKRLGKEYVPARVGRNVRIDGHTLEDRQAIIMIYITTPVGMGIGDKLVIANQMKSTVGEILIGSNRTLEGEFIDAIFGAKSVIDRIVTSPFDIGTTNTVLRFIGEEAYADYFGE